MSSHRRRTLNRLAKQRAEAREFRLWWETIDRRFKEMDAEIQLKRERDYQRNKRVLEEMRKLQ